MTHTIRGATLTTEGLIPNLQRGGLSMPVALAIVQCGLKAISGPQAPQRGPDGALRYVAPGGGVVGA